MEVEKSLLSCLNREWDDDSCGLREVSCIRNATRCLNHWSFKINMITFVSLCIKQGSKVPLFVNLVV